MKSTFLQVVAGFGGIVHLFFAYQETFGWNVGFVKKAALPWVEKVGGETIAIPYVEWAKDLAFNMGVYNVILAIGLIWVAIAGGSVAGSMGVFLSIWLLGAAAAAFYTSIKTAFYAQGLLGIVLLIASVLAQES